MQSFLDWWQHIPLSLSPVVFTLGSVALYWYSLFFLFGAFLVYRLTKKHYTERNILTSSQYDDFAFGIFVTAFLGGKIGFLLFYWWPFVFESGGLFLPSESTSSVALPGMSFLGGLLAVAGFIIWYSRKHLKPLLTLTDLLVPFIPIAIFFGRLGNFAHVELLGRVTQHPWGMYFPGQTTLRHPSTLYAAFLEGVILFSILFFLKKKNMCQVEGNLTSYFCIFYGILRFISEIFREPDVQIGYLGILTLNQIMAAGIFLAGLILFTVISSKNAL